MILLSTSYSLPEFSYDDLFRLWESVWAARLTVTEHFEEFLALALLRQYRSAIMDARLTPSDILSLFNGGWVTPTHTLTHTHTHPHTHTASQREPTEEGCTSWKL